MRDAPGMLITAGAFRGEFEKMLLALGVVLVILLVITVLECVRASGPRGSAAVGWLAMTVFGGMALVAAALTACGLI